MGVSTDPRKHKNQYWTPQAQTIPVSPQTRAARLSPQRCRFRFGFDLRTGPGLEPLIPGGRFHLGRFFRHGLILRNKPLLPA